jgi:HEAT repeat protein
MSLSPQTDAPPARNRPRNPNDLRLGPRRTAAMLVFVASWIAVVGGFYGWRALHASKADLATRIQDVSNPKTQQDATIEMAARMKQHDPGIKRWYPALLSMAKGTSPELRGIAAWVMANDPSNQDFHQVLLKLTKDSAASVRANAAVSLVNFKDPAGHQTIVDMLNDPHASSDQQWEALRALRVIGTPEDLPLATRFKSSGEERIRDVAADAAQDITDRMKEQKSRRSN